MWHAGLQLAADLHDQRRAVCAQECVLAILRVGQVRVHVLQFLRGDARHFATQLHADAGKLPAQAVGHVHDAVHDLLRGALERVECAILARDDLFPVPLVHVDRVEVVQLLVASDGVHIGVQAAAHVEIIALQRQALPLGQRMHHLALGAHGRHVEADGALHAVQVVVQAGLSPHEQRRGHAAQVQRVRQLHLEVVLDKLNGQLGVEGVQRRRVAVWDHNAVHEPSPLAGISIWNKVYST